MALQLHPELLAHFPKFFHLGKGVRSSGWLQLKYSSGAIPGKPLKRKSTEEETGTETKIWTLKREESFICLAVWKTVAEIFRGQEGHGMLVDVVYCITVSPKIKGYLVRQRFWQFKIFKSINKMMDINNDKC